MVTFVVFLDAFFFLILVNDDDDVTSLWNICSSKCDFYKPLKCIYTLHIYYIEFLFLKLRSVLFSWLACVSLMRCECKISRCVIETYKNCPFCISSWYHNPVFCLLITPVNMLAACILQMKSDTSFLFRQLFTF